MVDKAEIKKYMDGIIEKLNEVGPFVAQDWGGSVQYIIKDLNIGYLLKLTMDGTVESCEEKIDEEAATGILELDSDTFVAIYSKVKTPMEAMAEGKFTGRKSTEALIKILPATVD